MEKYLSPLRGCDDNGTNALQIKNTSTLENKTEDSSSAMEIEITFEKSPGKIKPSTPISDNKNKLKKLKIKKNRGQKRKFPDKSDQKKIKRKRKEEKPGTQTESNTDNVPVDPQPDSILKKEGSTPAENNSDMESVEKTKHKPRKSKAITNKCRDALDILLKLDSSVLESMDQSLKIIKNHSLLSYKYITIDILLDLISLALEKREDDFESSLSLIVSKCISVGGVTVKQSKVKQNLISGGDSPMNKSLQEEVLQSPESKIEIEEKPAPETQTLEEIELAMDDKCHVCSGVEETAEHILCYWDLLSIKRLENLGVITEAEKIFEIPPPVHEINQPWQIEPEVLDKIQEKSGKNLCITNYFKKLKKTVEERDKNERFSCFTTKTDMFLAPKLGGELTGEKRCQFEKEFTSQQFESNYLLEKNFKGKSKKHLNAKQESIKKPLNDLENPVANEDEAKIRKRVSLIKVDKPKLEAVCRAKAKLFQFHDNRRPPYWGTWRRKSDTVGPRKPFGKDKVFNYEIDSDDEWEEEEEPGESLHGSDDDKEPEEDYEVDNDFFVPHGYLSDDENPEKENVSSKAKLDLLEEQFTSEIKQKTRKMTPIVFGTFWAYKGPPSEGTLYQDLQIEKLQYVPWTTTPVEIEEEEDKRNENVPDEPTSQVKKTKQKIFPNEEIPNLIKMIHGSPQNSDHLARKFLLYWETERIPNGNRPGLTKVCVQKKIKELAAWQASHEKGKMCWQVPKETREEFGAQTENKTPEKKPRKCFIWKFVRKAEKNPSGVGNPSSVPAAPPTPAVEPEVVVLET